MTNPSADPTTALIAALRGYDGPHASLAAQLLRNLSTRPEPVPPDVQDLLDRHPLPSTAYAVIPIAGGKVVGGLTQTAHNLERFGWTITSIHWTETAEPYSVVAQQPLIPHWSYPAALERGMAERHPWVVQMLYAHQYAHLIEQLGVQRVPVTWTTLQNLSSLLGPQPALPGNAIKNGTPFYPELLRILHDHYPDVLPLPDATFATLGTLAPHTHARLYETLLSTSRQYHHPLLLLIPGAGGYIPAYADQYQRSGHAAHTVSTGRNDRLHTQPLPEIPAGTYALAPGRRVEDALLPGAWIPHQ